MNGAAPVGADRQGTDRLELELRLLPGVVMVGIDDSEDPVSVEVVVADREAAARVRSEATHLVETALDRPAVLEVLTAGPPPGGEVGGRVRLFVTRSAAGVDLHLSHRDRRVAVSAPQGDHTRIVAAVIEGLGRLGLPVPFRPVAVSTLPDEVGDGVIVVLSEESQGGLRRGIAMGPSADEAAARAALNALNRYLQDPSEEGRPEG